MVLTSGRNAAKHIAQGAIGRRVCATAPEPGDDPHLARGRPSRRVALGSRRDMSAARPQRPSQISDQSPTVMRKSTPRSKANASTCWLSGVGGASAPSGNAAGLVGATRASTTSGASSREGKNIGNGRDRLGCIASSSHIIQSSAGIHRGGFTSREGGRETRRFSRGASAERRS